MENTLEDTPPMSIEDEFYFICNTINSILTQPPINYTSLRNVLYNSLGLTITLSTYQMAYIINKVKFFRNTFFVVKFKTDFIKTKKKKSEKYITDSIEILKITLTNVIRNIE